MVIYFRQRIGSGGAIWLDATEHGWDWWFCVATQLCAWANVITAAKVCGRFWEYSLGSRTSLSCIVVLIAIYIAKFEKMVEFLAGLFFIFATASIESYLSLLSILLAFWSIDLLGFQTDLLQMQHLKCVQKTIQFVVRFIFQTTSNCQDILIKSRFKLISLEIAYFVELFARLLALVLLISLFRNMLRLLRLLKVLKAHKHGNIGLCLHYFFNSTPKLHFTSVFEFCNGWYFLSSAYIQLASSPIFY